MASVSPYRRGWSAAVLRRRIYQLFLSVTACVAWWAVVIGPLHADRCCGVPRHDPEWESFILTRSLSLGKRCYL